MSIGNCDCCDRREVPGSVVDCPGEPFACFICQGDPDPDPYCEIEAPANSTAQFYLIAVPLALLFGAPLAAASFCIWGA